MNNEKINVIFIDRIKGNQTQSSVDSEKREGKTPAR